MLSSPNRLIAILVVTLVVVAWVALACEDCGPAGRHFLRQLVRFLR